jgi:dolichyl-phosphate-mannose-protein mannosyltransferase
MTDKEREQQETAEREDEEQGREALVEEDEQAPLTEDEPAPVALAKAPVEPAPDDDGGGRRSFLASIGLERWDVTCMVVLLAVAFFFRFFSPLMPTWFEHPFQGFPITNCVHDTPINAKNQLGTLCGLAYPYQRNYAAAGQPATPPNGEVFDEIYFGVDGHDDLLGISYFDPEPPVAKYLIGAGEWTYGMWRKLTEGLSGSPANLGFNTLGWRLAPCIFGSLCIPLMYLLAIQLWRNRWFAVTAATLSCFDGLFFIESRVAVIDVFPIFFIILSYALFLIHLKSKTPRMSIATLILTGVSLGLGVASKWIDLAALASILFFLVARPLVRDVEIRIGSWSWGPLGDSAGIPGKVGSRLYTHMLVLALILIPIAIYLLSWVPWFFFTGPYAFHSFNDLVQYNYWMYEYQATLKATHPYSSKWYTWPFLIRPVAYYYESIALGYGSNGQKLVGGMVDLGNPVIWWASIPAMLWLLYYTIRDRSWQGLVIWVGFATQYFPFAHVTRILFLYHMFGGLIFMILGLAFVLAKINASQTAIVESRTGERRLVWVPWVVPAFLTLAIVTFFFFYPVWTALPISQEAYLSGFPFGKMWLESWI